MFKAMIVGNLTNDPETRDVGPDSVTSFGVAANARGKDSTVFVRVSAWGKRGKILQNYFHKGSKIAFTGSMGVPRIYTTKDGKTGVNIDVTLEDFDFCDRKSGDADDSGAKAVPTDHSDFKAVEQVDLPF